MKILALILSPIYVLGFIIGILSVPFVIGFSCGYTILYRTRMKSLIRKMMINKTLSAVAEDENREGG